MNTHDIIKIAFEILFALTMIIVILVKIVKDRKEPVVQSLKNSKDSITCKPGHGETCVEHDRKIVKMEACMEYIQRELPEVKVSIDENRKAIEENRKATEKSFIKLYDLIRRGIGS